MHSQAALILDCNSCQEQPDGHSKVHMQKHYFLRECIRIFIKEKECALGINLNLRARLFYPAGIRSFYTAHGNTEKEEKTF